LESLKVDAGFRAIRHRFRNEIAPRSVITNTRVMMGSRGSRGGDEIDAFSRRSRHLLRWRPGVLRAIKRRFWKRARAKVRDRRLEVSTQNIDDLAAAITPANSHGECQTGGPVGNEFR
jgi:hypothetical protein